MPQLNGRSERAHLSPESLGTKGQQFRLGGSPRESSRNVDYNLSDKPIYPNRRKFRSQISDNMDRSKRRGGKSQRKEEKKKEDADARKCRKVAIHCVFLMICGSEGSKSRLAKAAGAEPCGQMRDEKLHVIVAQSTWRSQKC